MAVTQRPGIFESISSISWLKKITKPNIMQPLKNGDFLQFLGHNTNLDDDDNDDDDDISEDNKEEKGEIIFKYHTFTEAQARSELNDNYDDDIIKDNKEDDDEKLFSKWRKLLRRLLRMKMKM